MRWTCPRSPTSRSLLLAAALVLTGVAPAAAGTYQVRFCGAADKRASSSWAPVNAYPAFYEAADRCASGGGAEVAYRGTSVSDGTEALYQFDAPPDTTITGARVAYFGQAASPNTVVRMDRLGTAGAAALDQYACAGTCPGTIGDPNATNYRTFTFEGVGRVTGLAARLFCSPGGGACTDGDARSHVSVFGAVVDLVDPTAPSVAVEETGLRSGAPLRGTHDVRYDVTDTGAGAAEVRLGIDGKTVAVSAQPCDPSRRSPCPLRAAGTIAVDTSAYEPGTHRASVAAVDFSGNQSVVVEWTFEVAPPPGEDLGMPNGTNAARGATLNLGFARNGRAVRTVAHRSGATVAGRLTTAAGAPIAGATVLVQSRVALAGTRYGPGAPVTTDADGRYRAKLVAGPSRRVRVTYQPYAKLADLVVSREIRLGVRAAPSLRIAPRALREGGTIRLRGTLSGGHVPARGVVVSLEAFDRGRWRQFALATARGPSGAFTKRYRFGRGGAGRYRMRAVVPAQAGYPFERGNSATARVTVR